MATDHVFKENTIGPFIKNNLHEKKMAYSYEIWKAYDSQRKEKYKSITYTSFNRYIYKMYKIGLIEKVNTNRSHTVDISMAGVVVPKWYRQYYKEVTEIPIGISEGIWNDMWNRPAYYYTILIKQKKLR